jgi:peptide/nickel transport system ATP-binding protein
MTSPQTPLLQVQRLSKHFAIQQGWFARSVATVQAVDKVSLDIYSGETFGLVGESGSGKTTLGRTILRAIEPTSGSIRFRTKDNELVDATRLDKSKLRAFRRHMQMIFQDPYSSLNPRMTVREIIAEPLVATQRVKSSQVEERVRDVAQRCRINVDYLRRYPHAFSGGERQRIGIARALVLNPEFVVCDEPVSALDVSIQAEILNLLADLQKEFGLTYLFIAHDLSVVEHISDRVAVMYLGRLVELAPTVRLFEHPLHPYTEALLSAIPAADPDEVMRPLPLSGEIPSPLNPPSGCYFHPRCPYVEEACRTTAPVWSEVAPGHQVACHRRGV